MSYDFDPTRGFYAINKERKNNISSEQIVEFMQQNYSKVSPEDIKQLIFEFDSSGDQQISLEEFSQIFLPSTDTSLRRICENRRFSYYYDSHKPLELQVVLKMVRLLEKELRLISVRDSIRKNLLKQEDFTIGKAFHEIANGEEHINLDNLVVFLQKNCFYPQREDLEAILRRIDHSADQNISYEEFYELASCNSQKLSQDQMERNQLRQSRDSQDLHKQMNGQHMKSSSRSELSPPKNYFENEEEEKNKQKERSVARKLDLDERSPPQQNKNKE